MLKRLAQAGFLALVLSGTAHAANCSAYTYTLTNGTTADANQVMSNFNNILNCGNNNLAPLANPNFTGAVTIAAGAAFPFDVVGKGRFMSPGSATTGAVIIRDASGDPNLAYLQFVNNSNVNQYGTVQGIKTGGIALSGPVGVSTATPSLTFFVNGTAGGTSAYQVVSDARLKMNIQPISNGLGAIRQLNPVSYDWRPAGARSVGKTLTLPTGERQIGFIAQEVEKVVPEAVTKPKDASGTYSLKEENLIPLLVSAIKEQQAEIEQLRAAVAALTPSTQH